MHGQGQRVLRSSVFKAWRSGFRAGPGRSAKRCSARLPMASPRWEPGRSACLSSSSSCSRSGLQSAGRCVAMPSSSAPSPCWCFWSVFSSSIRSAACWWGPSRISTARSIPMASPATSSIRRSGVLAASPAVHVAASRGEPSGWRS